MALVALATSPATRSSRCSFRRRPPRAVRSRASCRWSATSTTPSTTPMSSSLSVVWPICAACRRGAVPSRSSTTVRTRTTGPRCRTTWTGPLPHHRASTHRTCSARHCRGTLGTCKRAQCSEADSTRRRAPTPAGIRRPSCVLAGCLPSGASLQGVADLGQQRDLLTWRLCLGLDASGAALGQPVQGQDHNEVDGGGHDDERNQRRDERAERHATRLDVVEVGVAAELADERHDDVDESLDHGAESCTDDDSDSEVNDVAPHQEVLETLEHGPWVLSGRCSYTGKRSEPLTQR